jgi:hypothetical protein
VKKKDPKTNVYIYFVVVNRVDIPDGKNDKEGE